MFHKPIYRELYNSYLQSSPTIPIYISQLNEICPYIIINKNVFPPIGKIYERVQNTTCFIIQFSYLTYNEWMKKYSNKLDIQTILFLFTIILCIIFLYIILQLNDKYYKIAKKIEQDVKAHNKMINLLQKQQFMIDEWKEIWANEIRKYSNEINQQIHDE